MFPNTRPGKEFVVEHEPSEGQPANPNASGERKPPTYTTVGSIYNPDAAPPILPPTRRPRPHRPLDLQSLQTNLLAGLPVQDTSPTSPTPGANRVPQYSQLQQNYDRAVSPPNVDEATTTPPGLGMSVPSIRSGNLPAPTLGLGIAFEGRKETDDIEEDEEVFGSEDLFPLKKHFSTPSLTNLASFRNPFQEAVKQTFAKARSTSRSGGRVDSSASLPQMASEPARSRMDSSFKAPSTNTGAPQPLKAGPPGQRQFIPSTFDGVNRAMNFSIPEIQPKPCPLPTALLQPQQISNFDNLSFPDLPKNSAPPDVFGCVNLARLGSQRSDPGRYVFGRKSPRFSEHTDILYSDYKDKPPKKIHNTLPFEDIKHYFTEGCSPDVREESERVIIPADWTKYYPLQENGNPNVLESEEVKLARLNARFYSGTARYVRVVDQIQVDADRHPPTKSIGVIGGERERHQKRNHELVRNADGEFQPRHISIEEANSMDESAHAAPLLGMAYVSLVQWKQASIYNRPLPGRWAPQFSKPDPAYIEDSESANSSFFSQERPDLPKKKKLVKRVRRGY